MTLVGVAVRQPLMVAFGQVPFAILLAAVALLLPAARSLDRRCANFSVDEQENAHPAMQLRRRGSTAVAVWMNNGGKAPLVIRRLTSYVSGPVEVEVQEAHFRVGAGRAVRFSVWVRTRGVGRSSLQGFDVEILDPWGLLAARDYLPCLQRFETYPAVGRFRPPKERRHRSSMIRPSRGTPLSSRSGTAVRELRDFQPGDPLRAVAWKATVRQRRLIAREFDDERTQVEFLALDISSSMRAGLPMGEKFDHAVEVVARLAELHLQQGRKVGLWTFDAGVYGELKTGLGTPQLQRIQRHLLELRSVVDAERTALSEEELQEALADYLLVQERLDFRHGQGLEGQVDARLLKSWLAAMMEGESSEWNWKEPATGVVEETASVVRQFYRFRGLELDPPSEVRPGTKVVGIQAVIRAILTGEGAGGRLTIVSDLCGIKDVESLRRSIGLGRRRGLSVRILAPFSPFYTEVATIYEKTSQGAGRLLRRTQKDRLTKQRVRLVHELFTRSERRERRQLARQLEAMGVEVQFIGPTHSAGQP